MAHTMVIDSVSHCHAPPLFTDILGAVLILVGSNHTGWCIVATVSTEYIYNGPMTRGLREFDLNQTTGT